MADAKHPTSDDQQLLDAIASFRYDPLGYVYFAYPWGEGPLSGFAGPDAWQLSLLKRVGELLRKNPEASIRFSVSSGHGIGKTALVSWLIQWFISTRMNPQIVVTANTRTQLETKTWRELSKWHKLMINRDWFEWTATSFYLKGANELWKANAIPWSKDRSEAFAGTHETTGVMLIFDEASAVDDVIWEVAEGAMTTPGALWFAFGNPTRNTGRFKECFPPNGKFAHRWNSMRVDSRTARMADKGQIQQWLEDYGEDSDFFRVRVKGVHPRASSTQFISEEMVRAAQARIYPTTIGDASPLVLGVDVARYGDDQSVATLRRGPLIEKIYKWRELSTMDLASRVADIIDRWGPQTTFVDVVGVGAGVTDRLIQLGYRVIGVNVGEKASADKEYRNLRAEVWNKMRDWLKVAAIPDDKELERDLLAPEYGFDSQGRQMLESKEDMKRRGEVSPDVGDSVALTFAQPTRLEKGYRMVFANTDFDPRDYGERYDPRD